jgi:hypothetical protein
LEVRFQKQIEIASNMYLTQFFLLPFFAPQSFFSGATFSGAIFSDHQSGAGCSKTD